MESLVFICKLILFFISILGYCIFINKKTKINFEFIPVIIFASIGLIEFFAGILNIMLYASMAIHILGIILFGHYLKKFIDSKNKRRIIKSIIVPNNIIILLMYGFFILLSLNLNITHYDNFSHWALIVEGMIAGNKLPNFESTILTYRSYPPGSACFIYYVCTIVGKTEQCMILGQVLLMLSGLNTIFAFIKSNSYKWIMKILVILFILFASVFNISFKELLVDNLLTSIGLAAISIIIYYYNDIKKVVLLSTLLSTFLILIKNSGIYFVVINAILLIFKIIVSIKEKKLSKKDGLKYMLFNILTPISMFFLWGRHVLYAYGRNSSYGRHVMSVNSYVKTFLNRSMEDIINITKTFLHAITDINNIINISIITI